jgi:hypothetical protein
MISCIALELYFLEVSILMHSFTNQAFLKKWRVESDFKVPNLPLSLRLKGSGCHYKSIYNNTGTK